jgi:hypothetical protein
VNEYKEITLSLVSHWSSNKTTRIYFDDLSGNEPRLLLVISDQDADTLKRMLTALEAMGSEFTGTIGD